MDSSDGGDPLLLEGAPLPAPPAPPVDAEAVPSAGAEATSEGPADMKTGGPAADREVQMERASPPAAPLPEATAAQVPDAAETVAEGAKNGGDLSLLPGGRTNGEGPETALPEALPEDLPEDLPVTAPPDHPAGAPAGENRGGELPSAAAPPLSAATLGEGPNPAAPAGGEHEEGEEIPSSLPMSAAHVGGAVGDGATAAARAESAGGENCDPELPSSLLVSAAHVGGEAGRAESAQGEAGNGEWQPSPSAAVLAGDVSDLGRALPHIASSAPGQEIMPPPQDAEEAHSPSGERAVPSAATSGGDVSTLEAVAPSGERAAQSVHAEGGDGSALGAMYSPKNEAAPMSDEGQPCPAVEPSGNNVAEEHEEVGRGSHDVAGEPSVNNGAEDHDEGGGRGSNDVAEEPSANEDAEEHSEPRQPQDPLQTMRQCPDEADPRLPSSDPPLELAAEPSIDGSGGAAGGGTTLPSLELQEPPEQYQPRQFQHPTIPPQPQLQLPQPKQHPQSQPPNGDGNDDQVEIGSWSSDGDVVEVVEPPPEPTTTAPSPSHEDATSASAAAASFHDWNRGAVHAGAPEMPSYAPAPVPLSYAPAPPAGPPQSYHAPVGHHGYSGVHNPLMPQYHAHDYGRAPRRPPEPSVTHLHLPMSHAPTWKDILPSDFFQSQRQQQQNSYYTSYAHNRKKLTLSLINVWEFTITIEDCGYYTNPTNNGGSTESVPGLRAAIKKISREHTGQHGRLGATFERGSGGAGIVPDDPLLRNSNSDEEAASEGRGRWRIPLGAYYALVTYLRGSGNHVIEQIPPAQLRAATLGRERQEKREFPKAAALVERGVYPAVARALAPYQRGGVEFVLDKDGRALLADEMGLGKTVQAIAVMSAFRSEWPLLVLCPSTARYHWEAEFRCWMGSESARGESETGGDGEQQPVLRNSQINVLTSGRDALFKTKGSPTQVVICSIGLIVNLVSSGRIHPGLFKAIVVDESHALKSKSTKRTKAVLPLLRAAKRCLLLSGTPALARPVELWPQLSALAGRGSDASSGVWCDADEFHAKYCARKGEEGGNKTRLAELHTMLTSTVMIRRMKVDILKNLPSKIREKAYINIEDEALKDEFRTYMQILRWGKGVLGKLARTQHAEGLAESNPDAVERMPHAEPGEDGVLTGKAVLHHLYSISGKSKIDRVTRMLKSWLADPTKGKLCIFAHHLDVLDEISRGAGLSNASGSAAKYIRIDGSTSPRARQEQILRFQTNPSVRIAILGITAAGVAVTLTASSTVWFAELFWTPAIMLQAEDRCHRIGQQARVRCLYFIGRGTLDEVLWRLIEKKFRDLGEFVEGKFDQCIALERELEDEDHEEILKTEDNGDLAATKRKAQDVFSELLDEDDLADDLEIKAEIDELIHEEEELLHIADVKPDDDLQEEDDVGAVEEKAAKPDGTVPPAEGSGGPAPAAPAPAEDVIELLDDDDTEEHPVTFPQIRQLYRQTGDMTTLKIGPTVQFNRLRVYSIQYPGPKYGLIMVSCNGRVVVKSHDSAGVQLPRVGSIIVGVNGHVIPHLTSFHKVLHVMKRFMQTPPVTVVFAEDDDFVPLFQEDFMPLLQARRAPATVAPPPTLAAAPAAHAPQQNSEVVDLLDDDDD
ncbi:hypothetical protein ACHAXT_002660 [Thalassiosira profunda]